MYLGLESSVHPNHVVSTVQLLPEKFNPADFLFSWDRVCVFIICKRMATGACINQMAGIVLVALRIVYRAVHAGLRRMV
jgi:hypothetical protein